MSERINRDDVVRVALALLDAGGYPALGMRRIAAQLGVQQSALYWHFDNKQTLLAAVADEIVATVQPRDGTQRDLRIVDLALQLRAALLRYRDGAELVSTAVAFELGAIPLVSRFERELTAASPPEPRAETAAAVLVHFILGYTTNEQQHRQATTLGAIAAHADDDDADGQAERFIAGIELILAGFGAQQPISPARRRPRRTPTR